MYGLFFIPILCCPRATAEEDGERSVPGETAERETPAFRILHSSTRRFLAAGPDSALALQALIFAEDVANRLERRLGSELPAQPANPLRLRFRFDEEIGESMIVRRRIRRGAMIVQHIYITNPETADPEEFLEALVAELLDRYLWMRQSARTLADQPAAFPAWFAVGCAQDLYPALRARNYALLRRRVVRGEAPSLALWLEDHPDGHRRPLARAVRGAAFEWLRSDPGFPARFVRWTERRAAGDPLAADTLFTGPAGQPLAAETLEVEWNLWLAAQGDVLRGWGAADDADLVELHQRLRLPARAVAGANPAETRWITPEILLQRREESWAREGTLAMRRGLARLQTGARGREFHAIVMTFDRVLAALASGPPRRRAAAALEEELRRARRDLAALEEAVAETARQRQAWEQGGYLGREPPEALRDRLERHLDELEARDDGDAETPVDARPGD